LIFVTLGTHEQPFDRALELAATIDRGDELLIQHGSTRPRPDLVDAEWVDYLESDDLLANMCRADVVISHAGVGSIITAVRNRKTPIVLPRLARFGEHVDDHQLELAERFALQGLVLVCRPDDSIADLVCHARSRRAAIPVAHNGGLRRAVAELALLATQSRALGPARTRPPALLSRRADRLSRA
jgi:UDP-N-acetylglucosamine transferase subunit ALG13